jgi:hypothetical protein
LKLLLIVYLFRPAVGNAPLCDKQFSPALSLSLSHIQESSSFVMPSKCWRNHFTQHFISSEQFGIKISNNAT